MLLRRRRRERRPLGATVGDFLNKPLNEGGLNFSRPFATAIIAILMVGGIVLMPQHAGLHPLSSKSGH